MSSKRTKTAVERWKEKPDINYWESVAHKLAESDFCNGQNDRGWKANFEFFLRPETHLKALEGQYEGKSRRPMTKGEVTAQAHQEMWDRLNDEEQAQKAAEVIDG